MFKKLLSSLLILLLVPGLCFGGVDLNGDADYIIINDSDSIDFSETESFTLSVLFNANSLPAGGELSSLLSKYDGGGNQGGYDLRLRNDDGVQKFQYAHQPNSGIESLLSYNYEININTWYDLGITYDASANDVYMYLNGVEVASDTSFTTDCGANAKDLHIGSLGFYTPSGSNLGRYIDGIIGEVRIYDRVLSSAEMLLLFKSKIKRLALQIHTSDLMLYLPLDDFSDGTALSTDADGYKDLSSNGNHGTGVDADGDSLNVAETVLSYPE